MSVINKIKIFSANKIEIGNSMIFLTDVLVIISISSCLQGKQNVAATNKKINALNVVE